MCCRTRSPVPGVAEEVCNTSTIMRAIFVKFVIEVQLYKVKFGVAWGLWEVMNHKNCFGWNFT